MVSSSGAERILAFLGKGAIVGELSPGRIRAQVSLDTLIERGKGALVQRPILAQCGVAELGDWSALIQIQRFAFHQFHQSRVACCDVERRARSDPMLDLFYPHVAVMLG